VAGIELAFWARVPNDTNFQFFNFKFHMISIKKRTSAERLFDFPIFQTQKKGLVLSDFLPFQSFNKEQKCFPSKKIVATPNILQPPDMELIPAIKFYLSNLSKKISTSSEISSGSGNRPRKTASSTPALGLNHLNHLSLYY